jgi:hypothetical protein
MNTETQRNIGFVEQLVGAGLFIDGMVGGPIVVTEAIFGAVLYAIGTHTRS